MISIIFAIIFAVLTVLAIGLQRTYNHYPINELKRRARNGDDLAKLLYTPVSYGISLRVLLWAKIIIFGAISLVLLAQALETWFAIVLIIVLLWVGFLWLPTDRLTATSEAIARAVTPSVSWLLNYLNPLLRRIGSFASRHRHFSVRTNLYEKEDIIALLEKQRGQPENRISTQDIDLVQHALSFTDQLVRSVMVPQRVVRSVSLHEPTGPKLMDDLYKSGYSRFPVYDGEPANIIGTLYYRDLVASQAKGHVSDLVQKKVYYIHEDFTLRQALQAFLKTKHHLFIVVNNFEEYVGILTIEDVLEQSIGKQIVDEFDAYTDMRAVAASMAAKEHAQHKKADTEVPTVVE